jgi:hypothetical protein
MAATRLGWFWILLLLSASGAGASERPVVVVHVDDRANVPASDLAGARREVDVIFAEAGVAIAWMTGRFPASIIGPAAARDGRRHVALLLVNTDEVPGEPSSGCTLGFAARKPAVAYAFYNRIAELGEIRPIDLRVVLGRVIAHELGHLLIPSPGHARRGLMRRHWTRS